MKITLSEPFEKPSLVAMGNFDGFHLGHRKIAERLKQVASQQNLQPILLGFDPHPGLYFRPEKGLHYLTSIEERETLIHELGLEYIVLPFNETLAQMEAGTFVREILWQQLKAEGILLGHDHRFGKGAKGDGKLLEELFSNEKKTVLFVDAYTDSGHPVSSSRIRDLLKNGSLEEANRLLAKPFALEGRVVQGEQRGRLLGFPTANLELHEKLKLIPKWGVYGCRVYLDLEGSNEKKYWSAIANIGMRPTFSGEKISIEAHLLDFSGQLYSKNLRLELLFRLRDEKWFASQSELIAQINLDIAACREQLKVRT